MARLPTKAGCVISGLLAALVGFSASDGWTLKAFYTPARKGRPTAILIHGAGSGKTEWDAFAAKLAERGVGSLALDLRGHGQSAEGPSDRRGFTTLDLDAAWTFLKSKGVHPSRVGLIGASVGANLATQAAAVRTVPWLVLLSPGVDYGGLPAATSLKTERVLLAASPEDSYAHRSVAVLAPAIRGSAVMTAPSGHGAQMLADEKFSRRLLAWIARP